MGAVGDMGAMGAMGAAGGAAAVVTILKYILITLGAGLALGLVGGLVYAGLKYPNPNKKQIFNTKQKIIVMVIGLVSVALIVFAFVKKPKPEGDMMVNGDMSMTMGVDENGNPLPEDGGTVVDGEIVDGESATDGEDSAASGEESATDSEDSNADSSSSESSSEAEASATPAPAPPTINGGGVFIGGGGGTVMMRPGM